MHKPSMQAMGGFVLPEQTRRTIQIATTIPRRYAEDPALLEQQLRQAQDREQYYEQQRKILLHEQSQLDRRKRNRRIFTRGGMLEAFMKKPLLLNDDQVYRLLKTAFNTKEVQDMENTLLSEASHGTGCDGAGSAGFAGFVAPG